MNVTPEETDRIDSYLREVGARLNDAERTETLANLESHIHEAIAARRAQGGDAGVVEAVLSEMDPPESYGSGRSGPASPRLSGFALASVLLLPWGLVPLWHLFLLVIHEGRKLPALFEHDLYRFLVLPLCLASMVAATLCGRHGATRIRNGGGTLEGMPLAVFGTLFYPVLIPTVSLLLLLLLVVNISIPEGGDLPSMAVLAIILLAGIANAATAWVRASRALREGKSCVRAALFPLLAWVVMMVWLMMNVTKLRAQQFEAEHRAAQEFLREGGRMGAEGNFRTAEPADSDR